MDNRYDKRKHPKLIKIAATHLNTTSGRAISGKATCGSALTAIKSEHEL